MWIKKNSENKTIKDVVLSNTGLTEEEFMTPKEHYHIDRLDEAAAIIKEAAQTNTPVSVVADYDADGICSAAIMWMLLRTLGVKPKIRIPRRFSEGYGLSEKIIDELVPGLLITVDNGIVAHAAIQKAKDRGFKVIVTDHHLGDGVSLPLADVVIDPNAIPDSADFNGYCGAGIALKLAIEILGKEHPLVPVLFGYAAIATVADVMPLIHENRFIVKKGIEAMTGNGKTTGLAALLERCGFDTYITSKDIGFKIAPILNAPGRLVDDGAMVSLRQLVYVGNMDTARLMANNLYEMNETRKEKKAEGLEVLGKIIQDDCMFGESPLCIYAQGLSEGLVGIYAGLLAEEYKTPCFVFTDSEDEGVIKGSGRTYGGIHIKNMLDQCSDILHKYGGHAEAAGVSVKKENFTKMKERFFEVMGEIKINEDNYYDLDVSAKDVPALLEELAKYAPYGEGNPEPVFHISDYELMPTAQGFARAIGKNGEHLKLFNSYANGIAFGMAKKFEDMGSPRYLQVYCNLSYNYFRGEFNPQAEIIEFQACEVKLERTPLAALLAKKASGNLN